MLKAAEIELKVPDIQGEYKIEDLD